MRAVDAGSPAPYNNTYTGLKVEAMIADVFKALAEESRIRIVHLLTGRELCVCEIETILDMTQSNASRHLNILRGAGIVSVKKESQWAYYSISRDFIEDHRKLYEYLCENMRGDVLALDAQKLDAYFRGGYNCRNIQANRRAVREAIRRPRRQE